MYTVKGGEVDPVLDCPSRSLLCMNFVRARKKKKKNKNRKKAVLVLILISRDFLLEENLKWKLEICHIPGYFQVQMMVPLPKAGE